MPLITWQLWLARELVKDYHLPFNTWKGCTINVWTFSRDWNTSHCAQTPRKIAWMGKRQKTPEKKAISSGKKKKKFRKKKGK